MRRRSRKPQTKTPAWAEKLRKTGTRPDREDPGFDQFLGWLYFGDTIPGLPPEAALRQKFNLYR